MENHENNTEFDTGSRKPAVDTSGWFDGKNINEPAFCEYYFNRHPMFFTDQKFYDEDGQVDEQLVRSEIGRLLAVCVQRGLNSKVNNLLEALKLFLPHNEIPLSTDFINLQNGTYNLSGKFVEEKMICCNRLPVKYNPDAAAPVWESFLDTLFYEEDIPLIQEYLGYLLIPTTRAQKMLMILGDGGEGKSVLGYVLQKLLGSNMTATSIQKLCTSRFARADQCGKLLMLDDDMRMDAIQDTDLLKSTVTNIGYTDVERKGMQSTQERLYVRIIGLGNGTLSALHDRSDGFYRRQLIVRVKPKDPARFDDPFLTDYLTDELEGILLWCIEGLQRLIANDYHFSVSRRSAKLLEEARHEQNNLIEFLESTGYIRFDPAASISSQDLYRAYERWCSENADKAVPMQAFHRQMSDLAKKYDLTPDKNLNIGCGKRVRGYHGVEVLTAGRLYAL